jgi:ribonuclease T1
VFLTGFAVRSGALRQAVRKIGVAAFAVACIASGSVAEARQGEPAAALEAIPLQALPAEAQRTKQLILSGGPFPYTKDGTVFFNREGILPRKPRGSYREYTVKTPGARNRGARRIVCAGTPPTAPEVCYYTADHYSSFKRIVQ